VEGKMSKAIQQYSTHRHLNQLKYTLWTHMCWFIVLCFNSSNHEYNEHLLQTLIGTFSFQHKWKETWHCSRENAGKCLHHTVKMFNEMADTTMN
jgi:hypothetical protein